MSNASHASNPTAETARTTLRILPTLERRWGHVVVPGTTVALFSNTKKMPGYSWGMPAMKSCPWAHFEASEDGSDAICGSCYAMKGSYIWPRIVNAYAVRFAWVRASMKSGEGRARFVDYMVEAIGRTENAYFRIHDSGDFFSAAYVDCWREIVARLPGKRFWAPTRAWQGRNPWKLNVAALASEPNVTVRPSALFFNAPAPRIAGFAAGSTAVEGASFSCPASSQGNSCDGPLVNCRACWDDKLTPISYHRH